MTEPVVESERRTESGLEAVLSFPPESDFFDGHFEGAPVLPGVVQTGTAVRALGRMLGRPVRVREVKKLKFAKVVHPGDRVSLSLSRRGAGEWAFSYSADGAMCASGVLVVEDS